MVIKAIIFLRYIEECIENCIKNGVKPNTVYMSHKQLRELEKMQNVIEISKVSDEEKGNKKVFGLDIISTNEDIFSVGYCATAYNRFLKF